LACSTTADFSENDLIDLSSEIPIPKIFCKIKEINIYSGSQSDIV